ncbi:MAG: alpha/beta fold hydrolase [Chloroflexota bacterium]|nr:alpha/beta fold hydrolase [Chloroflexota bacterium]
MKLEVITREPEMSARPTPILFVHGMFHAAWCWDEHFLAYFAANGYRTHALSLRGHGGSEGPERLRWTSLGDYVSDLSQVVNELDTTPVLVGHSMGGLIVQRYLQSHQAPAAVLLGSVSPRGLLPVTLWVLRHHPLTFMRANLTLSTYPVVASPERYRELFFCTDVPETKLTKCCSRLHDESYRASVEMILSGLRPPGPITDTPLLVLGGADDIAITPGEVEATARRHNTRAELFPNMGHMMMLESGWETVADRILGWLGEQGV